MATTFMVMLISMIYSPVCWVLLLDLSKINEHRIFTPRRACASKGLCDRSCPFIYIFIYLYNLYIYIYISLSP